MTRELAFRRARPGMRFFSLSVMRAFLDAPDGGKGNLSIC
jgi:hypothetical protein